MTEISGLETSSDCAGCKDDLDLLKTHLTITEKAQKVTFVLPARAGRSEDDSVEEDDENAVVLGTRSGIGTALLFHDHSCVAAYYDGKKSTKLKLKLNLDEDDPYAEGSKVMHGDNSNDAEDGDEG